MAYNHTPHSLYDWSILTLSKHYIETYNRIQDSKSSYEVKQQHISTLQENIEEIPEIIAYDYVDTMISLLTHCGKPEYLRELAHPKCPKVIFNSQKQPHCVPAFLGGLKRMKSLKSLTAYLSEGSDSYSEDDEDIDEEGQDDDEECDEEGQDDNEEIDDGEHEDCKEIDDGAHGQHEEANQVRQEEYDKVDEVGQEEYDKVDEVGQEEYDEFDDEQQEYGELDYVEEEEYNEFYEEGQEEYYGIDYVGDEEYGEYDGLDEYNEMDQERHEWYEVDEDGNYPITFSDPKLSCATTLAEDMQCLRNLTNIEIPKICTYSLLKAISDNCSLLRELDVSYSGFESGDLKCLVACQKLEILNCEEGNIWEIQKDVAFLINKLPELRTLRELDFCAVLSEMSAIDKSERTVTEFKLECVTFKNKLPENVNIRLFCKLFPNIKEIDTKKRFGKDLMFLKNLKHLIVLMFGKVKDNIKNLSALFRKISDRIQFLEIGHQRAMDIFTSTTAVSFSALTDLHLRKCENVSLTVLNNSAPNLTDLYLNMCTAEPTESCFTTGYKKLNKLTVSESYLSCHHLRFLLGSCRYLESLDLEYIKWPVIFSKEILTDDVFLFLISSCERKELRRLVVKSSALTKTTVKYLVENYKTVESVHLHGHQWANEFKESFGCGSLISLFLANPNADYRFVGKNFFFETKVWSLAIHEDKLILNKWNI